MNGHPDISPLLIHLTGRAREKGPIRLPQRSPEQRLASILQEGTIRASTTYYAPTYPVVCFTESTMTGVEYLVSSKGFKPWGVVFKRRFVYDRGGGPVYYMRSDDWDLRDSVPLELRSRLIEFAPDKGVDWIEEREWRVVYREGEIGFEFEPDDVEAVVVGDADWREPGRPTSWTAPYSRWYWDGERLNQLS